jgi:hypothetical protein
MRTVICLASLCIGCLPNAASLATPAQYSVVSARGSRAMQVNRDHYRYKKWYQNDQRFDGRAAESSSREEAVTVAPAEQTQRKPEPSHAPSRQAPAEIVPTLHLWV